MAEYPGLPNWNYGLHIDPAMVLGLIPGTPQQKRAQAEREAYEANAYADRENATTRRMEAESGDFANLGQLATLLERSRGMDGTLTPEAQMLYDEVIRKMGMTPGPRGLPAAPQAGGAGAGVTAGSLADAEAQASQSWTQGAFSDKVSDVLAPGMAAVARGRDWIQQLFSGGEPGAGAVAGTPETSGADQAYRDPLVQGVKDFFRIQPENDVSPFDVLSRSGRMGPGWPGSKSPAARQPAPPTEGMGQLFPPPASMGPALPTMPESEGFTPNELQALQLMYQQLNQRR